MQKPAGLLYLPPVKRINRTYALLTLTLFVIEVMIALFVKDSFVRPFLGDTLAVILVYTALRSVGARPVWLVATGALAFAFFLELLQYFRVMDLFEEGSIFRVVLGSSYATADLFAYAAGWVIILVAEWYRSKKPGRRVRA